MPNPNIAIGAEFLMRTVGTVWRVEKILRDGIHIALVNVEDRTWRKTFSALALVNRDLFVRQPG